MKIAWSSRIGGDTANRRDEAAQRCVSLWHPRLAPPFDPESAVGWTSSLLSARAAASRASTGFGGEEILAWRSVVFFSRLRSERVALSRAAGGTFTIDLSLFIFFFFLLLDCFWFVVVGGEGRIPPMRERAAARPATKSATRF